MVVAMTPAVASAPPTGQLIAVMGPSGSMHLAGYVDHAPRSNLTGVSVAAHGVGTNVAAPLLPRLATLAFGGAKRPSVMRKRANSAQHSIDAPRPVLAGAAMQLSARVFAAFGLVMQRAAAIDSERVLLRNVGLVCYLATLVPDALSYLLAPPTLLTTLFGVEPLIVSVVIAVALPCDAVLITGQHSIATALCILGSLGYVLCIIGSGSTLEVTSSHEVQEASVAWFDHGGDIRVLVLVPAMMLLLGILAAASYVHKDTMLASRFRSLQLPIMAAASLALQRLLLRVLSILLQTMQWQPLKVVHSPPVLGCVAALIVCTMVCCHAVVRGIQEALPHIFVPLYTTMSVLLQYFMVAVIMREFRDETVTDRLLLPVQVLSIAFAFVGISKLHTAQHSRTQFVSTWGRAQNSSDFNCLAPVPLKALLPQ